jgi:3-polyprenyl-4-hydroxybenzoate decarboxylase
MMNGSSEDASQKYEQLCIDHKKLVETYKQLRIEHKKLLEDYSENTIIQSMNEMKERYEELVSNTISLYTHNDLKDKFTSLSKYTIHACVVLEQALKSLDRLTTSSNNVHMYKIEVMLKNLKNLLDNNVHIQI